MDTLGSVVFINTIFFIVLILLRQQKIFQICGILILIGISTLRWDIGNDFYNYYYGIIKHSSSYKNIAFLDIFSNLEGNEPFHQILIYIFKNSSAPVLIIIGLYSSLTILLLYKTLKEQNGLFWGFFALFYGGYLFLTWDQIRQGLAIAVFLYSIKYIHKNLFLKYCICCGVAFFCHYSAIILFPFYFFKNLYLPLWLIILSIGIMFIGFWMELWTRFFMIIFSINDQYIEYILKMTEVQEISSGIGILAKVFIYSSIIILLHKDHNLLCNILLTGLLIYLFSCSNELLERLSNYGMASIILGLPCVMKRVKLNFKFNNALRLSLVSLVFLIGIYDELKGAKGSIPYDSIFSRNYEYKIFRPRQY